MVFVKRFFSLKNKSTKTCGLLHLEIKVVMMLASRVEQAATTGALVTASQVLVYRKLGLAVATKNGGRIEFFRQPNLRVMTCGFGMAFETGIIFVAAPEFNRDNIQG
jgi:hypothetical protein